MSVLRTDFLFAFFNKIVNRVYYANIAVLSTAMTLKLLFLSKLEIKANTISSLLKLLFYKQS